MFKNYMFDLYGTLADTHTEEGDPKLWESTAAYYTDHGAAYEGEELQKAYINLVEKEKAVINAAHPEYKYIDIKIEKVFAQLYRDKGLECEDKDAMVLDTALYFRRSSREYIKLYDGIAQLLDDLKKRGANVYLLTNAQRSFTWDELGILGIRDKFDGIVISSDEECCKPDPHFYRALLDRYGLNPKDTIMVGNDPTADIKGAKGVGLSTLYIHTNLSPELDENADATYFIPDGDTLKMRDYLL